MPYLQDYLLWTSGTECPETYRLWAALSLIGTAAGRKVWLMHGRYPILTTLYIVLVGSAGSGKSTAKNDARKLFCELFPDIQVSASFQSHQDIIDKMCNDPNPIVWEEGTAINTYTPFYIICNEFSSLLSTDKKGMVEFLVDIFDESEFSTGYKGQRRSQPQARQTLKNPFLNVLCCATPKWFMGNLKIDLFDGGLGRRLIIVYSEKTIVTPDPIEVPGGIEARERVKQHLKKVAKVQGEWFRTPEAMVWWKEWYLHNHSTKGKLTDPILLQFYETKHTMVLKVALCLSLSEPHLEPVVTVEHLDMARGLLDSLEPSVVDLTKGIGRNELAGIGVEILNYITRMGGAAQEISIRRFFDRYLNHVEFQDRINHLISTEQIFIEQAELNGYPIGRVWMTPAYHMQYHAIRQAVPPSSRPPEHGS